MNYKLIIFDVDGTLTETKSGQTFRQAADDWKWLPRRVMKLNQLIGGGTRVAFASNQGGVAFGYLKQDDILRQLARMAYSVGAPAGSLYICYTHPKATIEQYRAEDDYRRKPGPGMLFEAMADFEANPDETLYVGDRPEDEEAAKNAGCAFMWADEFFKEVGI